MGRRMNSGLQLLRRIWLLGLRWNRDLLQQMGRMGKLLLRMTCWKVRAKGLGNRSCDGVLDGWPIGLSHSNLCW